MKRKLVFFFEYEKIIEWTREPLYFGVVAKTL